jgi:hypothetical protein
MSGQNNIHKDNFKELELVVCFMHVPYILLTPSYPWPRILRIYKLYRGSISRIVFYDIGLNTLFVSLIFWMMVLQFFLERFSYHSIYNWYLTWVINKAVELKFKFVSF